MGLAALARLVRIQPTWPTVKGLAKVQMTWRSGRDADGKALRMPALLRAISHAVYARAGVLFATLEADTKGSLHRCGLRLLQISPASAAALALWRQHGSQHGLTRQSSRLYSSASACASEKISSRVKMETLRVTAADVSRPGHPLPHMGCSMANCGGLCGSQNALMKAWLRIAARSGIAATLEPHVKQRQQRPRTLGLSALPNRLPSAPFAGNCRRVRAPPPPAAPTPPPPQPCLLPSMAPRPPYTCPFRHSSATHIRGRGRCQTLRSWGGGGMNEEGAGRRRICMV